MVISLVLGKLAVEKLLAEQGITHVHVIEADVTDREAMLVTSMALSTHETSEALFLAATLEMWSEEFICR